MRFLLSSLTIFLSLSGVAVAQTGWEVIQPRRDLTGWTRLAIPSGPVNPETQWKIEGDVLVCEGDKGHEWLRFDREFGDLVFHVEFRYTPREGNPRYNSGIFIRNAADSHIWHQVQIGGASGGYIFGDTLVGGEIKRINLQKAMTEMRVKPAGEWNVVEVTAKGATISASVNGAVVSEFTQCEFPRGYIGLEAEGYRIEFRNLKLKRLP